MLQVDIPGGVCNSTLYVIGTLAGRVRPSGITAGRHDNMTAFGM